MHGLALGLATLSHRPPWKRVRARSHPPELLFGTTTRFTEGGFVNTHTHGELASEEGLAALAERGASCTALL